MQTAKDIILAITEKRTGTGYSNELIIKAMKQYAKLKCKEQRQICADAAYHNRNYMGQSELSESMNKQPAPKFK
jgi:hypothetical protein